MLVRDQLDKGISISKMSDYLMKPDICHWYVLFLFSSRIDWQPGIRQIPGFDYRPVYLLLGGGVGVNQPVAEEGGAPPPH